MALVAFSKIGTGPFNASNTPVTGALDVGTGAGRHAFIAVFWRSNQSHTVASVSVGSDSAASETALNSAGQYNLQAWRVPLTVEDMQTVTVTPAGGAGNAGDTLILCAVYDDVGAVSGYATFDVANIGVSGSTVVEVENEAGDTVVVFHVCRDPGGVRTAAPTNFTERGEVGSNGSPVFGTTTIEFGDAVGDGDPIETTAAWNSTDGSSGRGFGFALTPPAGGSALAPILQHFLAALRRRH